MEKISAVMKEYNEQADENDDMTPDATVYGLTFALFPVHRPKDE
jgi:hypothetical protein